MAVNVTVQSNLKIVKKNIKKLQSRFPRIIDQALMKSGFHLVTIIRELTQKGQDFRRRPFAPYSEGYIKRLEKEGKPTGVDLFYSGRMMGALTPNKKSVKKTSKNVVSISFSNAQMRQRALFNQVLNEPNREFFAFNNRTEKIISKSFNRDIASAIKRLRI